jgi:cytoskeleton protein RodZ
MKGGEGISVEGDVLKSKDRLNFLEIEEVSGAARPEETPRGVGLRLAQAREGAGYSLAEVAGYLRVRKNYLEAIEAERYDALPGRTYAIGFVRAYAELLGLDAARLVNDFKAETAALKSRTELVFPSPPPEGRIPGGAILFVSVLVALLAYGGWYYISVTEKGVAELVPAVPERLVALLEGGHAAEPVAVEASARQAVAATARDEEPPLPAPATPLTPALTAPAVTLVPVAPVEPQTAGQTPSQPVPQATPDIAAAPTTVPATAPAAAPAASAPAEMPAQISGATLAETPAAAVPSGAEAREEAREEESTPEPSSISGAPTTSGPVLAAREPAASEEPAPAPAPAPAVPPSSASEPSAPSAAAAPEATQTEAPNTGTPQTVASLPAATSGSGAPEAGSTVGPRIVLHATDEVWLQIRDGDSALVTRILRKGDTYRVPNRSGLTLLTGNAGALEILVDGQPAPTLGPLGAVRRDVALDPRALLAGADARQ